MDYNMTKPCADCPFLNKPCMKRTFPKNRLDEFASGEFPCHKTAEVIEDDEECAEFHAKEGSQHCAGALIYLEKRNSPHQMMRIAERLGMYDRTKLDMDADVR